MRLGIEELSGLAMDWRDRVNDEKVRDQMDRLLDPGSKAKGKAPRAALARAHGTDRLPVGDSIFDRVNALPVRDVAGHLGIADGEQVTCPGCGETLGLGYFENGVKCFHDRCSDKGKNGYRTNVDLVMDVHGLDAHAAAMWLATEFDLAAGNSANSANSFVPWALPEPLAPPRALPPFLIEVLPDWLMVWVLAEAVETQTPTDLVAMVVLAVCAAAVAKVYQVCVRGRWREPLNIFAVAALPPASRKTAVFTHGTKPLNDYQRELGELHKEHAERAKIAVDIHKKRLETAIRDLAGKVDARDRKDAVRQLQKETPPPVPERPRLIADDTTPEAIVKLLAANAGRLAVLSSEGGLFDVLAGAYSDRVNIDPFLKGHAGEPITVDRIGRPSVFVSAATLTVGLTVQPSVLQALISNPEFRARGLSARFLYFFPPDRLGSRDIEPPLMLDAVRQQYEVEIRRRLMLAAEAQRDAAGEMTPKELRLSGEAQGTLCDFMAGLEPRLGADGDLHGISDWAGKLA